MKRALFVTLQKTATLFASRRLVRVGEKTVDFDGIRPLGSRWDPRHPLRAPSERALLAADTVNTSSLIAPLYQGFGTHYVYVWVGTPPQRKSVIVDTGSGMTAFPCVGCDGCGEEYHTDAYFDPSLSITFQNISCDGCYDFGGSCLWSDDSCVLSASYVEGSSWRAYGCTDMFYIGSNNEADDPIPGAASSSVRFAFGCKTESTHYFVTQLEDGIMGMDAGSATLQKYLHNSGKISRNIMALCFSHKEKVSKDGVAAGVMSLGGVDERLHTVPMLYSDAFVRHDWYSVRVRNIYLRGNNVVQASSILNEQGTTRIDVAWGTINSGGGIIVDSGTTDTYLDWRINKPFGAVWKEMTGKDYDYNKVFRLNQKEFLSLPTVLFQLEASQAQNEDRSDSEKENRTALQLDPENPHDLIIKMPPGHYMEKVGSNLYRTRLYFVESSGGVLGSNLIRNHNVLFDAENTRLGWAESACDVSSVSASPSTAYSIEPSVDELPSKTQQPTVQPMESPDGDINDVSEVACSLCQDGSRVFEPHMAIITGQNLITTCGDLEVQAANVTSQLPCSYYHMHGSMCGCNNTPPAGSCGRLCGRDTPLPDPERIFGSQSCFDIEQRMLYNVDGHSNCFEYVRIHGDSCCKQSTAVVNTSQVARSVPVSLTLGVLGAFATFLNLLVGL